MKIHAIGGYSEVGKNMTALESGDDVFLFDAGLFLPAIVGVTERERIQTEKGMRALGALPDDIYLDKHGLREKANVLGTPFTMEVLKVLMADSQQHLRNKIISVNVDGSYLVKGKRNYKV